LNEALFRDMLGVPAALVAARETRATAAARPDAASPRVAEAVKGAVAGSLEQIAAEPATAEPATAESATAEPAAELASDAETRPAAQLPLF
jgi:hypothetical protein